MRKNLGFTLIEILVAVTLTGMILLTGYSAFQSIMQAQASL
jgi:prepilin-type N-terminal cleavage/methylation domain-containing protein